MISTSEISRYSLRLFKQNNLRIVCGCSKVVRSRFAATNNEKRTHEKRSYATRPNLVELTKDKYPNLERKGFAEVCYNPKLDSL